MCIFIVCPLDLDSEAAQLKQAQLSRRSDAVSVQGPDGSQQYTFLVSHLNGDVRIAVNMADPKERSCRLM